ncbi:MAG TPA: PAS domain-containing protein, partial [Dehalococcoidia bacterium]
MARDVTNLLDRPALRSVCVMLLFAGVTAALLGAGERTRIVDLVLAYYGVALAGAAFRGRWAAAAVVVAGAIASTALLALGEAHADTDPHVAYLHAAVLGSLVVVTVYALPRWLTDADRFRAVADELRARKAMLETLIHASPVAVITLAPDLTITGWNPAAEKLVGWTSEESLGNKLPAPPRGADDALARIRRSGDSPTFTGLEGRRRRKDGEWIDLSVSQSAIRDGEGNLTGYISIATDITAKKRAEAALRESEERFRRMADNTPVMIGVAGPDGRTTFCNRAWLEFRGRTLEQEMNFGWLEGVHADDYERVYATYSTAFKNRTPLSAEYRLQRADGEYRWVLTSEVPQFDDGGELTGYIGSAVDITERRQAEDAIRARESQMRGMVGAIPDMVFRISREGRFLDVSAGPASGLMVPRETLVGRKIDAGMTGRADEALALVRAALDTGTVQTADFSHETPTGRRYYESRYSASGDDEVVVITRDITERHAAEEQALFQLHLLAQVEDAIVAVDNDFVVTLWNRAAEVRYG